MTTQPEQKAPWQLFQLLLLAVSTWSVLYARFSLGPLQEAMRADLALSDNQMALLLGPAVAVPMVLSAIPLGLIVDRWSRARLILIFVAINLGALLLTAFASSLPGLLIARCLSGVSLAAILIASYAMVGDLYSPQQRGRATMTIAAGELAGAPTAFALGGALLVMSASMTVLGLTGWHWALLMLCVPLLPALLVLLFLREPRRASSVRRIPLRESWKELSRYRGVVVPLMLARVMVWIADGAVLVWAAPSFERRYALPADQIGVIIASALLIGGISGPLVGGVLADFCHRKGGPNRTMLAMGVLALLSAPAGMFAIMPDPTLAGLVLTIFMGIGYVINVMATTQVTILVPSELRGLFVAISLTGGALFCLGLAPVVVSSLSVAIGGPSRIGEALAIVCAGMSLVGAAIFVLGRRHFPRTFSEPGMT